MIRINQGKHSFPKSKQAWASYISNLHDSGLKERRALEAEWARNIAYYLGHQKLSYNKDLDLIELNTLDNDEEYVINRIAPFVEQRLAKLTRAKPILTVLPSKLDDTTVKAAELSEHLVKYLWKVLRKHKKLDYLLLLCILMGCGFKKTVWDGEGGEPIFDEQDDQGRVAFDEITGKPKPSISFLGEIDSSVKSSFDIIVSPGVTDIPEADWLIDRSHRTLLDVKKKFPNLNQDLALKETDSLTRYEKFVNQLGVPMFGGPLAFGRDRKSDAEITDTEMILVKEYWQRPNQIYKKGILATVIGSELVQFEAWPYDHMEIPYTKFDCITRPFGFYGISPVTRLIPVQRHYNEARTQIAKNARLLGNSKYVVAKGSGLHEDALTDEEGEVLEYNPNVPAPAQMAINPLPNFMIENQNQDIVDIRDIGGERSVDQQPFSNLTAGIAIEAMAELSDIGIGPTFKNVERSMIREGRQELMLANQLYTDERALKIVGPNVGDLTIQMFRNEDLMGQTDVTIQMESALGQSKAAAQQKLVDLWDRRIIVDPQRFMKAFVTGDLDIILKDKDPSEAVVIEQIEMIKQGANPVISPFDNHVLHATMLMEWIRTPEFRRMPPDRQVLATQTLQQHLGFLGQAASQEQPEQNQAAVNTPSGQQVPEGGAPTA